MSEIQAALGHADLGTTGRYLAQLCQEESPSLGRVGAHYHLADRLMASAPPVDAVGAADIHEPSRAQLTPGPAPGPDERQ